MDEFIKYMLDEIQGLREDAEQEPNEKKQYEFAAATLVQALTKYNVLNTNM